MAKSQRYRNVIAGEKDTQGSTYSREVSLLHAILRIVFLFSSYAIQLDTI